MQAYVGYQEVCNKKKIILMDYTSDGSLLPYIYMDTSYISGNEIKANAVTLDMGG